MCSNLNQPCSVITEPIQSLNRVVIQLLQGLSANAGWLNSGVLHEILVLQLAEELECLDAVHLRVDGWRVADLGDEDVKGRAEVEGDVWLGEDFKCAV